MAPNVGRHCRSLFYTWTLGITLGISGGGGGGGGGPVGILQHNR